MRKKKTHIKRERAKESEIVEISTLIDRTMRHVSTSL